MRWSQDANVGPLAAEPSLLSTAVLLSCELRPGGTGAVSQPSVLCSCCPRLCCRGQRIQRQTFKDFLDPWRPKSGGSSHQRASERDVWSTFSAGNFLNGYNIFSEVLETSENSGPGARPWNGRARWWVFWAKPLLWEEKERCAEGPR